MLEYLNVQESVLFIFTRKLNTGTCILHLILMFIFGYRQISKRRMFVNLGLLKSKFSYLTIGKYRKVGFIKIGEKTFVISETSAFPTWPKWRFVLRRSFFLTLKEILKTSKLKPKNGDLGPENGHGSKRSLFVTEDFAEEDGELQSTIIKKLLIQMYCHCLD